MPDFAPAGNPNFKAKAPNPNLPTGLLTIFLTALFAFLTSLPKKYCCLPA